MEACLVALTKLQKPFKYIGMILKVEKILKGSLDSILSLLPSVKIQIMGGKVCLRCKSKTLLGNGHCQQTFEIKSLLTPPSNGLPHYLKLTFPPIIFALKCET